MIRPMFAIFDIKTESFLTPFILSTTNEAIRMFTDVIIDKTNIMAQHPEDYILYELGTYDNENAEVISNSDTKKVVITGQQIEVQNNEQQ